MKYIMMNFMVLMNSGELDAYFYYLNSGDMMISAWLTFDKLK